MTVLVVGASGLLGSTVVAHAQARDHAVVGTYHSTDPELDVPRYECDLGDPDAIDDLLDSVNPTMVVNCAAMTDVDGCESRPEQAMTVNADAPERLATACAASGREFVHVSTDYVFDGTSDTPYTEDDDPNPIQVYGETKLAGDRRVQAAMPDALIVRLSFVYGLHHATGDLTGFPAWVKHELAAGNTIPLFTDQSVTPSRAGQVATTILDLAAGNHTGVYNVASRDCVTPYDFGSHVKSVFDLDGSIEPGNMSDIDRQAARPAYSCLDVSRVEAALGRPQPGLVEDLKALR